MTSIVRTPTLVGVMRQLPTLHPEDSVSRALDILRMGGVDLLPVTDPFGRLLGVVSLRDFRPLLARGADEEALLRPVSQWMRWPGSVGRATMDYADIRAALLAGGEAALPILDESERYLGAVPLADLLHPLPIRPRPSPIGGMATPWGVYLTNGSLQAGVGNAALVATGALLGLLLAGSHYVVGLLAWALQRTTGAPLYALWNSDQPAGGAGGAFGWMLLNALSVPVFLLLLRSLSLAQFHAAEHQAVHAMERGEPLKAEVVRRMPRIHPRCGTNIMAAGLIFAAIFQGVAALPVRWLDASDGAVLGALTALFTWRSVGAFLQQYFTTRPAESRHIASAIAAAEELEDRYLRSQPGRRRILRRLWCMGMAQTMAGILVSSTATYYVCDALFQRLR